MDEKRVNLQWVHFFSYTEQKISICVLESFYVFFMEKTRVYGTIVINMGITKVRRIIQKWMRK